MKVKRQKKIRKTLVYYKLNHGIKAPYKVARKFRAGRRACSRSLEKNRE